jgi:hypothetical protein
MKHFVVYHDNVVSFRIVKHVRICKECKHYKYDTGSMCRRLDPLVHNVITGAKYERFSTVFSGLSCQAARYSDHKESCGIEGKFWEPLSKHN